MNRNTSPGSFTRAALHIARAPSIADAALAAEDDRASADAIKFLRTKAATAAGSLNASTWGSQIANDDGAVPAFIESLRSASIFYTLASLGNVLPMRTRVLATAALPAPTDHAEAGFIPVIAGSFSPVSLPPRVSGGIVVVSDELVRASDPASFAVLTRELQKAVIAAVDTATLTDEILAGVTPGTLSAAAPLTQLRAMLDAITAAGAGVGRPMWACGTQMKNYLATASLSGTARLFPEVDAGMLLGYPLVVSDRLAATRLVMIDASGFAVNTGTIDVDRSQAAALQIRDDPASDTANLVSMFQTNATALRIIAAYGCERMRTGSVAISDLGA